MNANANTNIKKTPLLPIAALALAVAVAAAAITGCGEEKGANSTPDPTAYTLTVDADPPEGGAVLVNGVASTGKTAHVAGAKVAVAAVANSGYSFLGWTGELTSMRAADTLAMIGKNGNLTLTAHFQKLGTTQPPDADGAFAVSFDANGGTPATINPIAVESGKAVGTLPVVTRTGYTFDGWFDGSVQYTATTVISKDVALKAVWTAVSGGGGTTYVLTVSRVPEAGGTVTVNGAVSTGTTIHDSGAQVDVRGRDGPGYTFMGWSGASTSTNRYLRITMKGDVALTANFQLSESLVQRGTFYDDRGAGQTYKIVTIGTQTWMAENLNFETVTTDTDSSCCYRRAPDSCAKYGRLYNWHAAMNACPIGWRLPTESDWRQLATLAGGISFIAGDSIAGKKLKSTTGWNNSGSEGTVSNGNGTDEYGFSAMPGGYHSGSFNHNNPGANVGHSGYWWSATEYGVGEVKAGTISRLIRYSNDQFRDFIGEKHHGYSVRCIQDDN